MLKLYDYWRSTASYRIRMALHYKQITHEVIPVHLVKNGGEHHLEWYKDINPNELVPTLQLEDGTNIGQSPVILQYLEDHFPSPPIIPSGANRYRALEVAHIIGCDLHPLNNLRVMQYLETQIGASQSHRTAWYTHWLQRGFQAVEERLMEWQSQGEFTFQEFTFQEFSIADIYILAQVYNANRFNVSLASFPHIQRIEKACATLGAFQKAYPREHE